jgi:hypothetical protein
LVRVFDGQLKLVATLEVLRSGFLWCAALEPGRPSWIFTDHPELIDVGEWVEGELRTWQPSDPRRARYLAVWHSPSHVMQLVRGGVQRFAGQAGALLGFSSLAGARRIGYSPAPPRTEGNCPT